MEPPTTAFAPDAFPESPFYIDAFHALSTERQLGAMGGAGRIPWSKAMLFADKSGMCVGDERDRFWFLIGALDGVYLEWLVDEMKKKTKKTD